MPEVESHVPTGSLGRSELIARRNALTRELLTVGSTLASRKVARPDYKPTGDGRLKMSPKEHAIIRKASKNLDNVVVPSSVYTLNGIHLEIYDYFCVNGNQATKEQLDRLHYIQKWVVKKGDTIKAGLRKLLSLDNRLGNHDDGEAKIIKLYNYLRLHG